jgi:hypothetical protein
MTTVVLARSRAGLVCALAVCVLAIVLRILPALGLLTRRSLAIVLVVLVALAVLAIASWDTIDQLIVQPFNHAWRPSADESNAQRWQSIVLGLQAWLQHPVFGNGLGAFLLDRMNAGLPVIVIHSVPVWFMAEMGLVGLAGYVIFVASLLWYGVLALWRNPGRARGLLVVVTVFVLMGLVHDVFFQRTFWFAIGLLLVDGGRIARQRDQAPSSS